MNHQQIKLAAYHSESHFPFCPFSSIFIKCNSRYMQQPEFSIHCTDLFITMFQCSTIAHVLCIISQHYGRIQMVLFYTLHLRVSGSTELQYRSSLATSSCSCMCPQRISFIITNCGHLSNNEINPKSDFPCHFTSLRVGVI